MTEPMSDPVDALGLTILPNLEGPEWVRVLCEDIRGRCQGEVYRVQSWVRARLSYPEGYGPVLPNIGHGPGEQFDVCLWPGDWEAAADPEPVRRGPLMFEHEGAPYVEVRREIAGEHQPLVATGYLQTINWWLSWYNTAAPLSEFELHSPWWVSGQRCSDDAESVVAAVRADDEAAAWAQVRAAYDDDPGELEQRFIEPLIISPFTDRFPQAGWMAWDDDRTCACDACLAALEVQP